ncbi:MAG: hypothetical protein NT001_03960, partial [Candidatus Woesearchaeota archaeon]|nr:hypothetical protein [Candidatus Woesearchaeota archaeon]
ILKEILNAPQLAKSLEEAKRSRIDSQYHVSDAEKADMKTAENAIMITESFTLQLRSFIDRIQTSEIESARKKLEK